MWAIGWHLPFSSFSMTGAHLAPSVTLSRWWSLLCPSFSTLSAKASSASFPGYSVISARAREGGGGRQRLGLYKKGITGEMKCTHLPAWLLVSYLKSVDFSFLISRCDGKKMTTAEECGAIVGKLHTQEGWWGKLHWNSKSESKGKRKRRLMSRFNQADRYFFLTQYFVLFVWAFIRYMRPIPHWRGPSPLLGLPIQILISCKTPSQKYPE